MKETKPKPFVFVLMPFSAEFNNIYELGIKPACKEAGAYCERVDEQIFEENIVERVYNQIAKADIIVSEMTGKNPNVFYETGYAHALNKRVILLTAKAEDIPFDLKHYPHIVHNGQIKDLKRELKKRVKWSVDNPENSLSNVDLNLEFFINGIQLVNNPKIISPRNSRPTIANTFLNLNIHNLSTKKINHEVFDIALITPRYFYIKPGSHDVVRSTLAQLPDGTFLYNFKTPEYIFPDGWHTFSIPMRIGNFSEMKEQNEFVLRLFTEFGVVDYPFSVRIK
jgi:hypothetical protein